MSKIKITGNSGGIGTFTIISPNSDTDATIELPHSGGTLVTNSQDLIPTQDEVYDLGSSSKAFKDLHISASTIFLGTQPIRATSTGIRFPELSIGSGLNRIRFRASPFGKLKQISTDSSGVELPEVDIPTILTDLNDVHTDPPTHGQTIRYSLPAVGQIETVTIPSQSSTNGKHKTVDNFNQTVTTRPTGTYSGVTGTSSGSGTVGTFDITVDMQNTSDGLQSGALVAPAYNLDGNQGGLYNQNQAPFVGGVAGQGSGSNPTYYYPRYPIWTNSGTFNTSFTVIDHKLDRSNHGSHILTGFAPVYPFQYTTSGSGGGATLNIALLMYDDAGFHNYEVGFDSDLVENGGNGFSDWETGFSSTSDNYKFHVWVSKDPTWHPDAEGNEDITEASGLNRLPYDDPNYNPSYLTSGTGFAVGDTITLTGGSSALVSAFGAITGGNDITIRIESGAVYSDPSYVSDVTIVSEGSGHSVGDTITIADSSLGATGVSDFEMQVATIDNRVSGTYTGVTGTSSGTGTVGTFDIVVDSTGDVVSATPISGGTDNVIGDVITIDDSNLGNGQSPDFTMNVASLSTQLLWRPADDHISVFSDFTDVDTVTTPPTDTQVLTWSDANNEWGAGNNGFPFTVTNTTELLALTGMAVGQEAFVTDLNRSYTYTGSTPNDNWRHAVSGWYATDDIMTNHPPTTITGAPSATTLNTLIPTTFNLSTDDPDEKPATFLHTFENITGTFLPGVIDDLVTITDNNGNITITNNENIDSGAGVGSNTFDVKFTVLDDSLYAVEGVESTTQITRSNLPGGLPDWENNTSWSTGIRMPGSGAAGQFWTHMEGWNTAATWQIPKDPITDVEWTWPHPYNSMQNLYGNQHTPYQADKVFFFGQSVDLDAAGNVLAISDPANNRVHIYNYDGTEWIKNQSNIISQYPTGYPDTSNPPAPPIGTYGGIIDGEYLSYGKNQIALSDDGNTLAVTAMDSTDGSGSPHVEIWTHTNNIWSSQQKLYPFSDMPSLPQTAIGMSVSLSSNGDTVVVGYRLAGQTIYPGSQFTTGDVHEYSNGQVYIYERNSDTNIWNTGFRVSGVSAGSLGAAVDISGDGMSVAMSAPNGKYAGDGGVTDGGFVYIYKKNPAIGWNSTTVPATWLLEEIIRPPVADQKVNNRFGFNSISLSHNGQHLAVGDIGQALTAVRETQGTGVMYRVLNYNYMTGTDHTFPNGVVYMYKKVSDNWTFNQYVENGSGTKDDGFGDRVSLSHNGKLLSVGAIYENTGFGFPFTLIGNTTFHDYSAKKVFNDWYRFSHSGINQPASPNELDAWNYTEATEAINCTVNSFSYIGFVTPPDGKATQYDLRVSFTSKNDWDNDMISIVIAFNTDANGKEHTISLIRSGGHIGYNYAIVYNYAQPDVQVIYNGVSLINDTAFIWGSTVATTGEGQFVRNRITRIGDQFTVTTSQLLHPNSHTGTDSDLDSSTTHTFNLANYSFGSLFSVANDGARWGFSCQSQDLSSWVNVDLRDAVNPDLIEDTGAVHVFELDSDVPSFTKRKRLLPVISNDPTNERYDPTYAGYSHLSSTSNHHMHNAPMGAIGSTIASGTRLSSSASQVNVWKTT